MTSPEPQATSPQKKLLKIAQVVVPLPIAGPFDYVIPKTLSDQVVVGARVFVPFGQRQLVGFVVGTKAKSAFHKLKAIIKGLDTTPALSASALTLAQEISKYYGCSVGEALETMLPPALRKPREWEGRGKAAEGVPPLPAEEWLVHDPTQRQADSFVIEQIKKTLAAKRQVIVLVPEVHTIAGVQKRLEEHLGVPVAVLDKKLSEGKECETWQDLREGKTAVVIGTRSAVFAPCPALGLIVILEEENSVYKQEQVPFYHARDVARLRATIEGVSLILVSDCPSAETMYRFRKSPNQVLTFPYQKSAVLQLIDLSNYRRQFKGTVSFPLQNHIQQVLVKGGKVVLFFNRRGFATQTRCNQCGYIIKCPRCEINLVFQYQKKKLNCHLCNASMDMPKVCPQCASSYLRSVGSGIEKLESEIARLFPPARVATFDRETERVPCEANVIVATQAIVRVLADLRPDLIGVLDFDGMMNRSDFRSGERAFALLTHFVQTAREKVLVQTTDTKNYCLAAFQKGDGKKFYRQELASRRELGFPPFKHLVAVTVRGIQKEGVHEAAQVLFEAMRGVLPKGVELFESQPDYVPKLRDKYRFTIMLKTPRPEKTLPWLKDILRAHKKGNVIVTVNVDP